MRALLIAEKPSLMREIEAVYNKHKSEFNYDIDFTSQSGHLLTLMLPDELDDKMKVKSWDNLPFIPERWKYKIIEQKPTGKFKTPKQRFYEIRDLINSGNYNFIIHAGDPDQEGELLVNMVLSQIGTSLPVARFWTNDLTEGHILNALKNLKNDRTDVKLRNLLNASYIRQHSDYLFGMNISRGASLKMGKTVACGRVKTFIQSVVVQREDAIANFKPETVYGVKAEYTEGFKGTLFSKNEIENDENADEDQKQGIVWFKTKAEAETVIKSLTPVATVIQCDKKHTKVFAPKLFKLSSAQMVAGKSGYNPDTVLSTIQSLYEKKFLSYPRTSCEYIGSNEDLSGILRALFEIDELKPFISKFTKADIERVRNSKKWVNDQELEKNGHSALRPTTHAPDLSKLTSTERFIYMMIVRRFVAMFMPPWEQDAITMITDINGNTFRSSGKVTTNKGYLEIFKQNPEDTMIPYKQKGDQLQVKNFEIAEKTSKCPPHLTEADLIAICENPAKYLDDPSLKKLGKRLLIGTEATRASIISQLINHNHYLRLERQGKKEYVFPTEIGVKMIRNLDGLMICRPDMTGVWEIRLEEVRDGIADPVAVEKSIADDMVNMLNEIKGKTMSEITDEDVQSSKNGIKEKCPFCGGEIKAFDWGYICANHKKDDPQSCQFMIAATIAGAKITDTDIKCLIKNGTTKQKTFTSKKTDPPKKYKACIVLKNDKTVGMEFPKKTTDMTCPVCGNSIQLIKGGYKCSSKSCGFIVWEKIAGKRLNEGQIRSLIENGETEKISGFKSSKEKAKNKTFSAKLKLKPDGTIKFEF